MASRIQHVAVLVPARDEEKLIAKCINSIQAARRALPAAITSDVIVVSDRCVDRTSLIARGLLADEGLVVSTNAGSVGHARATAARFALTRYREAADTCWLANTDADCEVPETWLTHQVKAAETGALALAGIVDVVDFSGHDAGVPQRFRETYVVAPDGTHSHVHGANLGVRADVYQLAGGWADLALAEEHDLWRRIPGGRVSDARMRVITSGRRHSRVVGGFADALAAHNESK